MASSPNKFTIGRDKSCDIAIADDSVSRLHAEISVLKDGKLFLTDRESSNGTILVRQGKSQRVKQETLRPSDRVRFGTVELGVKELVEALRRKYPAAMLGEVGQAGASLSGPVDPNQRKDRLIRCSCGTIKTANERCPACGE